jgi:hypothetical protein
LSARAAIWSALEALEAGDSRHAVDVLLAAVEDECGDLPADRDTGRFGCRFCTARFDAPGAVEGHEVRCHPWEIVDAA